MTFSHIAVRPEEGFHGVFRVTFKRPEVRNAMSDRTLRELAAAFRGLSSRRDLRAVVVRGEGKDFCAGADIEWMRRAGKLSKAAGKKDARLLFEALSAMENCPVPVLAAAQGAIFGGGLGILAAADATFVSDDARLCFSECRLGILPAVVSCFVIPKIGEANARRYYLTAEVFGAEAARMMGLVDEAVPAAELEGRVRAAAESVLKNGPNAVRATKRLLLRFPALAKARRSRETIDTLVSLRSSPEGQEGLSAFLEKRAPAWIR